jgi:hypothetical protein
MNGQHNGIDVAAFIIERDAVLLSGDVNRCVAFMLKFNPELSAPSSYEVAEISMHKAITAAKSLPMDYRVKSYRWLVNRGYSTFDDGDVKAAAEQTR